MDQLIGAFDAARLLGFHNMEERPPHGERMKFRRCMCAFQAALDRGLVPPPDGKRGRLNMWRRSTLKKHIENGGKMKKAGAL